MQLFLVCPYQCSLTHTNSFVFSVLLVSSMNIFPWHASSNTKHSHVWRLLQEFDYCHLTFIDCSLLAGLWVKLRETPPWHNSSILVSSGTQSKWMCSLGALWLKFLFSLCVIKLSVVQWTCNRCVYNNCSSFPYFKRRVGNKQFTVLLWAVTSLDFGYFGFTYGYTTKGKSFRVCFVTHMLNFSTFFSRSGCDGGRWKYTIVSRSHFPPWSLDLDSWHLFFFLSFFFLSWVVYLNLCGPWNSLSKDRGTAHTVVCSSANLES